MKCGSYTNLPVKSSNIYIHGENKPSDPIALYPEVPEKNLKFKKKEEELLRHSRDLSSFFNQNARYSKLGLH